MLRWFRRYCPHLPNPSDQAQVRTRMELSQASLRRELGVVAVVGLLSSLVYFEWLMNNMWIFAYLRHWIMGLGYFVGVVPMIGVLSFMEAVLALLIALLGLGLLVRHSYSMRRGLVYGLIVGLLGVVLSTVIWLVYVYSFDVQLPAMTSEEFRLLHPPSLWYTLYLLSMSILDWSFLIGASIGGFLSAIIGRVPKKSF